jgi:hypothetical protein
LKKRSPEKVFNIQKEKDKIIILEDFKSVPDIIKEIEKGYYCFIKLVDENFSLYETPKKQTSKAQKFTRKRRRGKRTKKIYTIRSNVFELFLKSADKLNLTAKASTDLKKLAKNLSECNTEQPQTKAYILYSTEEKFFCLELVKHIPIDVVVNFTGIAKKSLKRWIRVGYKRLKGCGRKERIPSLISQKLFDYIRNHVAKYGSCPVFREIREKMLSMTKDIDGFRASKGWWEKWKARNITEEELGVKLTSRPRGRRTESN